MKLQESVFLIVPDIVRTSELDVAVQDSPIRSNADSDIICLPPKFKMYFSPELLRQFMIG